MYVKGVSPSNAACAVRFTPAIWAGTLAAEAAAASLVVAAPVTLGGLVAEEGGLVAAMPTNVSRLLVPAGAVRLRMSNGCPLERNAGQFDREAAGAGGAARRAKGHHKAVVIARVSE